MDLRIYEMAYGDNGNRDWVAARSIIEALQVLVRTTSITLEELDYTDMVKEIPESMWAGFKIKDENDNVMMTFRDWMNVNNTPDIIATSAK